MSDSAEKPGEPMPAAAVPAPRPAEAAMAAPATAPRGAWSGDAKPPRPVPRPLRPREQPLPRPQDGAFRTEEIKRAEAPPPPTPRGERPAEERPLPAAMRPQRAGPAPKPVSGKALMRMIDADLGADLEAAMATFGPDAKLAALEPAPNQRKGSVAAAKGEKRSVRVLKLHGHDVFVELGGKSEGIIPAEQFGGKLPSPGDFVEAVVDRYDNEENFYRLRLPGAAQEASWDSVAKGMVVEVRVVKANKGGLEIVANGLRGFMPAGQSSLDHLADLGTLVGQTLKCEITEANPGERNLVVSRKAVALREREELAVALWAELREGQPRDGVVKRVQDFGAFIDLGGADGLLPVSQLRWQRVKHPSEILAVGQTIKVQVLSLDPELRKITLSLKGLETSPWVAAAESFVPGSIHAGKVSKLMDFGAFVELSPAIEGLVHISELSNQRVRHPRDVVQENQEVTVKVLNFDPDAKRISLSIKQAAAQAAEAAADAAETAADAAPPAPVLAKKPRLVPLKGGTGNTGGPLFG